MKVLGIADSDSYTKWGASILARMPGDWDSRLVIIRTPALPSARQLDAALAGTGFDPADTPRLDLDTLAGLIAEQRPDVVLLAVRGPVVRVLVRMIVKAGGTRPLIVSGLPGISIPETLLALYYRAQVDLIILHSKREVEAFQALAERMGIEQDFALATLPFLAQGSGASGGGDVVFAAQAKVPRLRSEREQVVSWLIAAARNQPEHRVVFKLRGVSGEAQTHSERYPYDELLSRHDDLPENLVVSTGPMAAHLDRAAALVTVSSTAALEAVAVGVPVIALDDFGVRASLINPVFEGSGLLGSSADLIAGQYRHPDDQWRDANYFHELGSETWIAAIETGALRRLAEAVPLRPQFRGSLGGNLRRIWDRKSALGRYDRTIGGYLALAVGLPLRGIVRQLRAVGALPRNDAAMAQQENAPTTARR